MEETVVPVSAAKGTIVSNDTAAAAPVQQVKVRDGQAQITLRSARETGRDRIKVSLGNVMEAEAEVFFTPELRDWVVAGIGSVTLGGKSVSGDTEKIGDRDEYKEGLFHAERLAGFSKGRLVDKILLTGASHPRQPGEE